MTGILTDTDAVTASLHRHGALAFWDYATAGNYFKLWKMLCPINQWLLTNASWILQPRTSWLSWLVFWHLTYNIYIPYACWWQIPFSWSKCPSLLQTLVHDQTWNDRQPHFETDVSLSCRKHGTKKKLLHSHEESNCRPWDSALQCSLLSHRTSLVSYSSYRPFQVEWIQVVWIQYIDRINTVQRLEFTITFFTSLFCILCFALQVPMLKSTWILW